MQHRVEGRAIHPYHHLSDLKGIGTKGKVGREDLGRPAYIGCPNREFQGEVPPVRRIRHRDSQRGQDVFDDLDVHG